MAIVSVCTYDAQGRLVRPDLLDIGRAKIRLDLDTGGFPTFDPGRTHVFVVCASGITPAHAHERVGEKLRRFFERADAIPGFRKILVNRTAGTNRLNRNTTITCEILYAVEQPEWTRSHGPESTRAGSRRDRGTPVHV